MNQNRVLKYREAISEALSTAMSSDPSIFIMGCGVDDEGGIFNTTREAFLKFGKERVIDTPLAENAIAGIGVGSAVTGMRPVIVHARNDFLFLAMDQIINHAAKWKIMSGNRLNAPLFVRAIVGRGWGQAAQHSQSLQSIFAHFPGVKVILPSTAYDAKGLILSGLKDDETVICIEHRLLYENESPVPEESFEIPLGKGDVKKTGTDITIVAFSYMVKESLEAASQLEKQGISVEVIDPRTVSPLDMDLIANSIRKTGKAIVADTSWMHFGVSAEVCAGISEQCFYDLKAPLKRIALPNVNTPCSSNLEKEFYPGVSDIVQAVLELIGSDAEANNDRIHSDEHSKFAGPF